jgi:hypothetical protein
MNPSSPADRDQRSAFQLCFQSLVDTGRAYAFPCDARGHVDMDALGERARTTYLYARTVVGREVAMPKVQPCAAS